MSKQTINVLITESQSSLRVQDHSIAAHQTAIERPHGHNLRWLVIAAISFLTILSYLDRGTLSVAAPVIEKDLGIDNALMGTILSAFVWPYAIMNLPSGWLIDRFGVKIILSGAAISWSSVAVLTGFARNMEWFIVLRACLGVSESPLFPGAVKATNSWFPNREKGAATSFYLAATQLGLALSAPVATGLMLEFGWPTMFVVIGLFGFLAVFVWISVYSEPSRHKKLHSDEYTYIRQDVQESSAAQEIEVTGAAEWRQLFRFGSIWAMITGGFCLQYTFWFYIAWLPTYLEHSQHFTIRYAGIFATIPFIAAAVSVLIGGRLSDALVRFGLAPFEARRYVVAISALLTALAMFATAFSKTPAMAIVLLTIGMFAYGLSPAPYWALATAVVQSPRLVASVGSIQNFGGFLGGACAPVVTGLLVDKYGGFAPAIVVSGVLALVSALIYAVVLRHRLPV